MTAYYNEIDPQAAQWLRNLIAAGHIAPGEVDERSIRDVAPGDLVGFRQCHFFAGIGVWSRALRLAGWDDDRPVWTGSCPCQPFSIAGDQAGVSDDRHLWPAWFELIRERRPVAIFGEQVASKIALPWLDHVHADLEGEGYAVGALDTCAAGFGAPHRRQRFFFVADARGERVRDAGRGPDAGQARGDQGEGDQRERLRPDAGDGGSGVVQPGRAGLEGLAGDGDDGDEPGRLDALESGSATAAGPVGGWWAGAHWIACTDGKARPVEPGTFPLAHGAPARVVRLRAYGNAIVAPQAEEFIRAYMSATSHSQSTCSGK